MKEVITNVLTNPAARGAGSVQADFIKQADAMQPWSNVAS
jgi:hypothetical protein